MSRPTLSFAAIAAIAALEGLALIAYAIYDIIEAVRVGITGPAEVSNPAALLLLIVIYLAFGIGLLLVARAWWQMRTWQRGAFILTQVIALLVFFDLTRSEETVPRLVGIVILVTAACGIILVFTPRVLRVFAEAQQR
jgi:hypothetical protein